MIFIKYAEFFYQPIKKLYPNNYFDKYDEVKISNNTSYYPYIK